jgi:hypothetical protein
MDYCGVLSLLFWCFSPHRSYVNPCVVVRICDECNFGQGEGQCVVCGTSEIFTYKPGGFDVKFGVFARFYRYKYGGIRRFLHVGIYLQSLGMF